MMVRHATEDRVGVGRNEQLPAQARFNSNDRKHGSTTMTAQSAVGGGYPRAGLGQMYNGMTAARGVGPVVAKERESR